MQRRIAGKAAPAVLERGLGGASVFYTFDPQGNLAQRLDSTGTPQTSYLFDAFGVGQTAGSASSDPFGFGAQSGYYTDLETGLMLLTNRYYDPGTGRFVTRDPIGFAGGMNQYGFVGNNPMAGIDPSGLCGDDAPDADVEAYIQQVQGGYRAFWGGVRGVGRGLQAGIEFAAAFNPGTSAGIALNKLGEHKYGEAALFALPAFGAFGGEGGAAEEAVASELPGFFGKLSGRSAMVSEKGLSIVERHLTQFGPDIGNAAMVSRLRAALAEGRPVTGADLSFYFHELSEATIQGRGVAQEAAHDAAFDKYGVSRFSVYHPEAILAAPHEQFGFGFYRAWGLKW